MQVIVSQIVIMAVSACVAQCRPLSDSFSILMAFYRIRNKQANDGKRELEGVASYRYTL